MSDLDVLVVRGSLVGSDVVVSPKLRVVIYGSPAHRLVSGALPRTGAVVEWTERTVVDLTSFSFSNDGESRRPQTSGQADEFEAGLNYLRQYAVENEDTFVPRSYVTDDGFRLGRWAAVLRSDFDTDRLDGTKVKAVEAVPHWRWDPYEPVARSEDRAQPHRVAAKTANVLVPLSSLPKPAGISVGTAFAGTTAPSRLARPLPFDVWFKRLEAFVAEHGHARPAKAYVDPEGFKLGRWVSHLREHGRRSRLSADESRALEALPGWVWASKPPAAQATTPTMDVLVRCDALGGPVGAMAFFN
jgi:hypothetical protein